MIRHIAFAFTGIPIVYSLAHFTPLFFIHFVNSGNLPSLTGFKSKMASSGYNNEESNADRNVEVWKIKKLIKQLEAARGYLNINLNYDNINICIPIAMAQV